MKVKFKKLNPVAKTPQYARAGDAGLDLTAVKIDIHPDYGFTEYDTGLSVEVPEGYVGLLFPRSSVSKTNMSLCNSVGVLDSSYRGPIKLRFNTNDNSSNVEYLPGDKIGQLVIMPIPHIEMEEVAELSTTDRGEGGFGSTDIKSV